MRSFALLLILPALTSAAPVPKEVKGAAKLDGLWEIVSMEVRGQTREMNTMRWKIEGEKVTILNVVPGGTPTVRSNIAIKIDDSPSPKAIDYNTGGKGGPRPGLYELAGDSLKILISITGNDRPKEMKPDETSICYTFKRVKE